MPNPPNRFVDFGNRLRLIKLGSNKKFAEQIRVSTATVENYLAGKTLPEGEILLRIVEATQCDAHWLMTGEGQYPYRYQDPSTPEAKRKIARLWRAMKSATTELKGIVDEMEPLAEEPDND